MEGGTVVDGVVVVVGEVVVGTVVEVEVVGAVVVVVVGATRVVVDVVGTTVLDGAPTCTADGTSAVAPSIPNNEIRAAAAAARHGRGARRRACRRARHVREDDGKRLAHGRLASCVRRRGA